MRTLLLVAALLSAASTVVAQPAPIRWGRVPEEHLTMRDFPADTNATAVVLADYGQVRFETDLTIVFERHRRVKILKEVAYDDWGTFSLVYYGRNHIQRVGDVRGQTIVMGPDGRQVIHKLERRGIFEENLNGDYRRVRFTLPALQPGAIVEYSYKLYSKNPYYLPDWRFQVEEPTLWSEYRAEIPAGFEYVTSWVGMNPRDLPISETKQSRGVIMESTIHRWARENIPALREEPFMTTPNDYQAQVRFQLARINIPGWGSEGILNTWDKVASEFMAVDGRYGSHLRNNLREVRDQAAAVVAGRETDLDKLVALYDYVRTSITFDGMLGTYARQSPREVLRSRSGSSPEINLLLVALLKESGIEAHPALLSTRRHGKPITAYPMIDQFNDLVAYAKVGSKAYLLDATDPLRPYNLLPYNSLNGQAWVCKSPGPAWVPIEAGGAHRRQISLSATLDENGRIAGTLNTSDGEYGALFRRATLKEMNDDAKYVREHVFGNLAGLTVNTHAIHEREVVNGPLHLEAAFDLEGAAQVAGDFIYLNPILFDRQEENPLRLPTRTFPVDMGYTRDQVYTLTLTLPEGYEVQEFPQSRRFAIPSGGGTFQRSIEVEGREIRFMVRFILAKPIFEPERYGELRKFYTDVVAAQSDQVVLRRVAAAPPESGD